MELLAPTLSRMFFLFAFLFLGFLLAKIRFLPDNAAGVLSKLENALFLPALVLGTFLTQCTPERLGNSWKLFLGSFALAVVMIPIGLLCGRLCAKTPYLRKIYAYGLCFSNFGFMGNAVVEAIFPDIYFDYLLFVLPLWVCIYAWALPALLLPADGKRTVKQRLRSFVNPMFICMVIGAAVGLTGWTVPKFATDVIDAAGSCMSPVAMILTGVTVAHIDVRAVLRRPGVYLATVLRLLVFPGVALAVFYFLPVSDTFYICAICSLAMPLGLSTIVIPAAYGMDTSDAAGMALVSHAASLVTIPIVFTVMQTLL